MLIVCPASLKLNWKRELDRWLVHDWIVVIGGPRDFPIRQDWPVRPSILILNYDILYKHSKAIRSIEWDLFIGDEIHLVKNRKARRSIEVLGIRDKTNPENDKPAIPAKRRLFLTGTPIVNRPVELWPIIHSLDPSTFSNWWKFANRFCGYAQTRFGADVSGGSNLDELQNLLRSTIMVRRLKKDVLAELPPKRRQVIEFPPDEGMADLIATEREAVRAKEDRAVELRAAVELAKASEIDEDYREAVRALRKGASADFTEISKLRHATALAKVPDVIEHLKTMIDDEGVKVVAFAHHLDVLAQISAAFPGRSVKLTGENTLPERQAAVDRFQNDERIRLFVGSITAAGVGLTLTAASNVVFAELSWVPGDMSQAEDRCHRIGAVGNVLVQHLVLEGSIDATMAQTLVAKQEVIEKALDAETKAQAVEPMIAIGSSPATEGVTRTRIAEEAAEFTPERIEAVHRGLQMLAGACDGANALDGAGFSKIDTMIGKSLAHQDRLTQRQAALGARLVRKYKRQLPVDLVALATGVTP